MLSMMSSTWCQTMAFEPQGVWKPSAGDDLKETLWVGGVESFLMADGLSFTLFPSTGSTGFSVFFSGCGFSGFASFFSSFPLGFSPFSFLLSSFTAGFSTFFLGSAPFFTSFGFDGASTFDFFLDLTASVSSGLFDLLGSTFLASFFSFHYHLSFSESPSLLDPLRNAS